MPKVSKNSKINKIKYKANLEVKEPNKDYTKKNNENKQYMEVDLTTSVFTVVITDKLSIVGA